MEALERAFGKALKQLRTERGLSQNDVLKLAHGLERTTYQKYDAGRRVPKVMSIIKIAEAMEIDPGSIVNLAYKYYKESIGEK